MEPASGYLLVIVASHTFTLLAEFDRHFNRSETIVDDLSKDKKIHPNTLR